MTYDESAALMQDFQFRGRIKVACLTFAAYIFNEAASVAGHSSRLRWAQQTFMNPDQSATQAHAPVVMDAAIQAAGAAVDDPALQTAVENVVNKML